MKDPLKKAVKPKMLLNDRVLVVPDEESNVTAGGIMLPDTAKAKAVYGKVIAIGPGKQREFSGDRHPMTVKVGDRVMFTIYSGSDIDVEGYDKPLRIMTEAEIVMTVE